MKKSCGKKLWRACAGILLALAVWITATPYAVAAETNGDADSQAQEIRQIQDNIVSWKAGTEGEKQLLAGELLDGAGSPGRDWYAFTIARMGEEKENQAAYLSRLQDAVENVYADLEDSKTRYRLSDIHRMALTAMACGGDPENFGTDPDGNPINLIRDTVWNSLWGDPGDQGINGYIWALLTIDAKNYQEPEGAEWTRDKIISELLSRQLADGGFGLVKTDPSDVDLTSMTLTALAPYQGQDKTYTVVNIVTNEEETVTVDEVAEQAFACLSKLQSSDGSMLTYGARTSESTSWAMLALASWGKDIYTDEDFIQDGNNLLDGQKAFALPDGGMIHGLDGDEEETTGNNMAGYQALYGLEAVYRYKEGQNRLFDLTDAETVSEDEIQAAGEKLPELKAQDQADTRSGEEVEEAVNNRTLYLTAAIAAAVVLVVVIFLAALLKDGKRKKKAAEAMDDDDTDDDEW